MICGGKEYIRSLKFGQILLGLKSYSFKMISKGGNTNLCIPLPLSKFA